MKRYGQKIIAITYTCLDLSTMVTEEHENSDYVHLPISDGPDSFSTQIIKFNKINESDNITCDISNNDRYSYSSCQRMLTEE